MVATIPGTKAIMAFYEYQGTEADAVPSARSRSRRTRCRPARHDLDGLLKRMRAAGVQVTSISGELVQFSPTIRNIFVVDPNGLNIELFESKQ